MQDLVYIPKLLPAAKSTEMRSQIEQGIGPAEKPQDFKNTKIPSFQDAGLDFSIQSFT